MAFIIIILLITYSLSKANQVLELKQKVSDLEDLLLQSYNVEELSPEA